MASITDISELLTRENAQLRKDLREDILTEVGKMVDQRLEAHHANIMKEIQELRARTEALEGGGQGPKAANASKRARSEPRGRAEKHEVQPVVVLTGFPRNSRRAEIVKFVKEKLAEHPEWSELETFTPNIRSSIAMVKVNSKDEVFEFAREWKSAGAVFKGQSIRARADKPPEQRKANGKVYAMGDYLRQKFTDKEVDCDFRSSSIWFGDWEAVKWDIESDSFKWIEEGLSSAAVEIDRDDAERCCARP